MAPPVSSKPGQIEPGEIEAKFAVIDASAVAPLAGAERLASGHALTPATEVVMVDTYLDTADFRLLRHGYGLRIRMAGDKRLATLKSRRLSQAAVVFRRLEIEEPLAADASIDPIRSWPEPIMQELLPLLDEHASLQPICQLHQVRTKRLILAHSPNGAVQHSSPAAPVGELSIDRVEVRDQPELLPLASFDELEIELMGGGDEAALDAIVAAVRSEVKLAADPLSKLEHALLIAGRHPAGAPDAWQGPRADMHMAEACRLIWREQLTAMLLNEAGVRYSDDPEFVHDMRVATRRARAAAKLYGDYFRPKAIRRYLAALRRTAHLLGAVRDLDVAIDKLARFERKRGKADGQADAAGLAATLENWRIRRLAAHAALVEWLDSADYAKFAARFAAFCRTPGEGVRDYTPKVNEPPTPYQVRHVTPSMILNRFESVRCFEALFAAEGQLPVERLHQLRIECKYLRYNLEFVANLLGPQATHLIADLRKLQEDLGVINDAAVTIRLVAGVHGVEGVGVERYLRDQEKLISRLSARVGSDLRNFVSHLNRRRLALAIAWI